MRIVQLFGRELERGRRFDALNRAHLDANLAFDHVSTRCIFRPSRVLTSIALASLLVAAPGASHRSVNVTVGTVAAFLQLVRRFFQPLQDLSDKYNTLQQAMASSERDFPVAGRAPGGRTGA